MNISFIKSNQKKFLLKELNETFGIEKIPHLLIESGKCKLRGFTGSMSREEIQELGSVARIEIIGLYIIKKEKDGLRFGLDGCHAFQSEIKKGIVEIDEEEEWMKGNDLEIKEDYGYKIVKFKDDLLGCTKSTGERLVNFIPKERRIRRS